MIQMTNYINRNVPNNTSSATFAKFTRGRGSTGGRLKSERSRLPPVDPERFGRAAGASEWLTPPKLDNPHLLVQLLLSDYCKKE